MVDGWPPPYVNVGTYFRRLPLDQLFLRVEMLDDIPRLSPALSIDLLTNLKSLPISFGIYFTIYGLSNRKFTLSMRYGYGSLL